MRLKTKHSEIIFGDACADTLNSWVNTHHYSNVFVLTDTNTQTHCLPRFKSHVDFEFTMLQMPAGEEHKHIRTCVSLWESLSDLGADRKSLLINLGGGVVTDLGGFVACTFKRGIDFINIPTSLLAMVDASVGGKTGIDLGALKNQVGVIEEPKMVLVETDYLETLPEHEYRSGYAEMLKHGLIHEPEYFDTLSSFLSRQEILPHIYHSVRVKAEVVNEDPYEHGLRKILNFGHTLGHAIESHFLVTPGKTRLLHGEAIAIGMVLEAFLSAELTGLPIDDAKRIKTVFGDIYPNVAFDATTISEVIGLLTHDKKNENGNVLFVLLKTIGKPIWNQSVPDELIQKSFDFYAEADS
ncbi:MAG: 3-dehydroquinate synthase [Flavobacteriales bacterium]|nr:MAG: 3-dehydroquinate synthase [Flavobacteriales bacterium]|tara:strand:+ start:13832 stop:14893 length:1062 start_codon:yes stop_codon:yes gene_type:complete